LCGHTNAKDFGPLALKAARQAMATHDVSRKVQVRDPQTGKVVCDPATGKPLTEVRVYRHGLARRFVNKQIGRLKRAFAWAVEEDLVPASVHQALWRVKGLKKGKGQAREKARVKPVPLPLVDATLLHLPAVVADMVRVQQLSGCRPQDVVNLRALDIDMVGPVWEYRPHRYKTEHHTDDDSAERERIVFFGPRAQAVLKPYLTLNLSAYLFSPAASVQQRNADRREKRKTKLWPSHIKHQEK